MVYLISCLVCDGLDACRSARWTERILYQPESDAGAMEAVSAGYRAVRSSSEADAAHILATLKLEDIGCWNSIRYHLLPVALFCFEPFPRLLYGPLRTPFIVDSSDTGNSTTIIINQSPDGGRYQHTNSC